MRQLDVLRSLVREATERVRVSASSTLPLAPLKQLIDDLRHRRVRVPEAALTKAVARASMVEEASVHADHGGLYVDARFRGDRPPFEALILPEVRAFAPRGAKELGFRVEPEAAAAHPLAADVLSGLAGVIAHHLWAAAGVPAGSSTDGAFVERDRDSTFRVDLRTVPAVRALLEGQASQLIIEALVPKSLATEDGALILELSLPTIFGP